jgi:hypothetical protein
MKNIRLAVECRRSRAPVSSAADPGWILITPVQLLLPGAP